MLDRPAPPSRRDTFIPVRKQELIAALIGDAPAAESAPLGDLCKLLDALLHHEAHARLEALKALYDPLDPDAAATRRDDSMAAFEKFEAAMIEALERANFQEIDPDSVQTRDATKKLTGLSIRPSQAGLRRIRYFARGATPERIERRSLLGLRKTTVDAHVLRDVVVLVSFKSEGEIDRADRKAFSHMRRGMRPGAALVKHFRSVAMAELVTLHPGATPSMRPRDQVFLAAPAIAGGVPVLLNLWPALTVLFAVVAAYFGAQGVIEQSELKRALAAASGLIAVGAFVMRQRLKYEAQTLRYQKQLADTIYFRNIANNTGVIDLLIGAGEEQDCKEAMLAYAALRRSQGGMSKNALDKTVEDFLSQRFSFNVDFEIGDALSKLERLGLVTRSGETYAAIAPDQALAKLDERWDGLFKFSERRA